MPIAISAFMYDICSVGGAFLQKDVDDSESDDNVEDSTDGGAVPERHTLGRALHTADNGQNVTGSGLPHHAAAGAKTQPFLAPF